MDQCSTTLYIIPQIEPFSKCYYQKKDFSNILLIFEVGIKVVIEIFYLPSYSPDLNPDELLNWDLKAALSKTPAAKRNGELEEHAKSHMRSIQKQAEKIKALFHKESAKYAG